MRLRSETSAARDVDEVHPISDMVEELQKIQVRMATGDKTAYGVAKREVARHRRGDRRR